jgi:hypothetical protein
MKLITKGNFFENQMITSIFGFEGAINTNTTERLTQFPEVIKTLEFILLRETNYKELALQEIQLLNIKKPFQKKSFRFVKVHEHFNKLPLCKVGQIILGKEILTNL